ncbi:ROK family protein [Alicyclobacillus shizuokensis]|uniref:ROK family protein n=1 Tax=Alicyclobacillus shizuokensis TaxID=392014 RepID=UPI000833B52B|nr:ROK family protein [Alicyclobacillus shizuokensis]
MTVSIGIDVGGTKIYGAVAEDMNVIHSVVCEVAQNFKDFTKQMRGVIKELCEVVPQVERIGVGIPGAVRTDGTCWVPNLPYLTGLQLSQYLEKLCGTQVLVANDGQLALLGEVWCGAAKDLQNAVLISVGTGIGGAILMDGRVRTGTNGVAGSLGWLIVGREQDDYTFYESIASGTALNQAARSRLNGMTSRDLIRAVKQGDIHARDVFFEWLKNLGMGIASIASVFDPEAVVITGGLSREDELILPMLRKIVSQFASPFTQNTLIRVGKLQDKATMYGAIRMAHTGSLS